MHRLLASASAALLVSACGSVVGQPLGAVVGGAALPATAGAVPVSSSTADPILPRSPGERASGFGYVPLDPIGVSVQACPARTTSRPLFEALPDLAVRFAVADVDADAGATFGPSQVTVAGGNYRAILDYINADTIPVEFRIRTIIVNSDGAPQYHVPSQPVPPGMTLVAYEAQLHEEGRVYPEGDVWDEITVPVYVGIGLRLFADIHAVDAGVTLSGLGVIGAEAEAKALSGTLTVQTLGITGKSIAVSLPLPSKLDQTTIENAILAVGGSRALMYGSTSGDVVTATPRIVGLYSPIGSDPRLINAVYSELARKRPPWDSAYCRSGA